GAGAEGGNGGEDMDVDVEEVEVGRKDGEKMGANQARRAQDLAEREARRKRMKILLGRLHRLSMRRLHPPLPGSRAFPPPAPLPLDVPGLSLPRIREACLGGGGGKGEQWKGTWNPPLGRRRLVNRLDRARRAAVSKHHWERGRCLTDHSRAQVWAGIRTEARVGFGVSDGPAGVS
ncbi:unnamed protein product, partial [Discosporangium mesarthrocarpum]